MKPSGVTHECIRKTSLRAGFQTTDMIYELVSYTTDKAGYLNELLGQERFCFSFFPLHVDYISGVHST